MKVTAQSWKKLFLLTFGLALSAAFCMKWMENDLLLNNQKFTILGLELFYSEEKVESVLSAINSPVRTIFSYHLTFDFAFMAGIYPCIASLCMMASLKVRSAALKKILITLAFLQLLAWTADIMENYYLLDWNQQHHVDATAFTQYHVIVSLKWILALAGAFISIPLVIFGRKK
jgi:hypothetical protein